MDYRAQLLTLIRKLSYKEGDFTLASGQKSRFYIDLKATTLHPEGAKLVGQMATEALVKAQVPCDAVGGLTLGADPIATAISIMALDAGKHWPAFIVRKEPKKHGTSQYLEGIENLKAGAKLVIVEDVVTTGASSLLAVERAQLQGYEPTAVLTIVDRRTPEQKAPDQDLFAKQGLKLISLFTMQEIQSSKN